MVPPEESPWPEVELGSVIAERREKPDAVDVETGRIPTISKITFSSGNIELRDHGRTRTSMILVRPGDLVVSGINAVKGAIAIYGEDEESPAAATIHYASYIPDSSKASVRYLWYLLRSEAFRIILDRHLPGGVKTELKASRLLPIQVPLPPPDEQRRIVAHIDELAALIEEAQGLRAKAREETQAILASALREVFRSLQGRPGLEQTTLAESAQLRRGKFSHRPRNDPFFFGGSHPWIQIGEIESAGKYITSYSETLNDHGLAISRKFPKGTLLVSIAATIGAIGILGFDCCIPDSIVAVSPNEDTATVEFLYYYLAYLRSHLESVAPQSAQKNINLKILSRLPVWMPNLHEQRQIAGELRTLEAQIGEATALQEAASKEIDALLPSLLDHAFKGEL
jgi:type I restriction enzyme S subunit